jgi:hypothetical protein
MSSSPASSSVGLQSQSRHLDSPLRHQGSPLLPLLLQLRHLDSPSQPLSQKGAGLSVVAYLAKLL